MPQGEEIKVVPGRSSDQRLRILLHAQHVLPDVLRRLLHGSNVGRQHERMAYMATLFPDPGLRPVVRFSCRYRFITYFFRLLVLESEAATGRVLLSDADACALHVCDAMADGIHADRMKCGVSMGTVVREGVLQIKSEGG